MAERSVLSLHRYTSRPVGTHSTVYAIALRWPVDNQLYLDAPITTSATNVTLLGYPTPLKWSPASLEGIRINVPALDENELPCKWAWVFRIEGLEF